MGLVLGWETLWETCPEIRVLLARLFTFEDSLADRDSSLAVLRPLCKADYLSLVLAPSTGFYQRIGDRIAFTQTSFGGNWTDIVIFRWYSVYRMGCY